MRLPTGTFHTDLGLQCSYCGGEVYYLEERIVLFAVDDDGTFARVNVEYGETRGECHSCGLYFPLFENGHRYFKHKEPIY